MTFVLVIERSKGGKQGAKRLLQSCLDNDYPSSLLGYKRYLHGSIAWANPSHAPRQADRATSLEQVGVGPGSRRAICE